MTILTGQMGCPKITYNYREEGLERSTINFCGQLAQKRGQQKNCQNYYPFGLTFNEWTRSPENLYKYNAGSEWQPELSLYSTPHRTYDAALGRLNGIDAMADLFPSMSPMVFGFNSPIKFNDPLGLYGNKNGEESGDGDENDPDKVYQSRIILEPVVVTADGNKKKKRQRSGSSSTTVFVSMYQGHRNPLIRGAAASLRDDGFEQASRNFSNKSIHFSHGGFLEEKARFSAGDAWMMIANRGIGGTMVAMYGAPMLAESIATLPSFSTVSATTTAAMTELNAVSTYTYLYLNGKLVAGASAVSAGIGKFGLDILRSPRVRAIRINYAWTRGTLRGAEKGLSNLNVLPKRDLMPGPTPIYSELSFPLPLWKSLPE